EDQSVVAEDAERSGEDQEREPGEAERRARRARDGEHENAGEREADRRELEGWDRRHPELAGGPAAAPAQRDRHVRGKGQEPLPRGDSADHRRRSSERPWPLAISSKPSRVTASTSARCFARSRFTLGAA